MCVCENASFAAGAICAYLQAVPPRWMGRERVCCRRRRRRSHVWVGQRCPNSWRHTHSHNSVLYNIESKDPTFAWRTIPETRNCVPSMCTHNRHVNFSHSFSKKISIKMSCDFSMQIFLWIAKFLTIFHDIHRNKINQSLPFHKIIPEHNSASELSNLEQAWLFRSVWKISQFYQNKINR